MWKKIISNKYLPLIILGLMYFYAHCLMGVAGDDINFRNAKNLDTISEVYTFLKGYYANWLPSVVPTFGYLFFARHNIWLWRMVDTVVCVALVYQTVDLFFEKSTRQRAMWVVSFLFMTYEFMDMGTAGWMATTVRYSWCLCCLLLSMNSIKSSINDNHISKTSVFGILLVTVYASNTEISSAILMPTYLLFLAYLYKENKNIKVVAMQTIITCISMFYLLTSPGNKLRFVSEIKSWYPEYANFSLLYKFYLGVTSTVANRFFDHVNWIYIFLVIGVLVAIKCRNVLKPYAFSILSAIYFIPIFCQLKLWTKLWGNFAVVHSGVTSTTGNFVLLNENVSFVIMICLICVVSICIGIYNAFDRREEKILYTLVFLAGFLSRVLMGFSPTIYESGTRTFIFFDFAMLIVAGKILVNYLYQKNISLDDVKWNALCLIGILSYFQLIRLLRAARIYYK